jgi:hypothetical protein
MQSDLSSGTQWQQDMLTMRTWWVKIVCCWSSKVQQCSHLLRTVQTPLSASQAHWQLT